MNSEDKKIPTAKIKLSPYASDRAERNRTVVKVSSQTVSVRPKKPRGFLRTPERPKKPDVFTETRDDRTEKHAGITRTQDDRVKKPDRFAKTRDDRVKKPAGVLRTQERPEKPAGISRTPDRLENSGDIWNAMNNRPKKPESVSKIPKRPENTGGLPPVTGSDKGTTYYNPKKQNAPAAAGSYEGAARRAKKSNDFFDIPEDQAGEDRRSGGYDRRPKAHLSEDVPFGSFIAELLFSALLLSAVSALVTININFGGGGFITFNYPGDTLWAYMCISTAVFALLRMFFRMQYFACAFVAFGTFFALNLGWFEGLAGLILGSGAALIGGIIIYAVLLAGFFFLLRLLYEKRFSLRLIVKILGGALAFLVIANAAVDMLL